MFKKYCKEPEKKIKTYTQVYVFIIVIVSRKSNRFLFPASGRERF